MLRKLAAPYLFFETIKMIIPTNTTKITRPISATRRLIADSPALLLLYKNAINLVRFLSQFSIIASSSLSVCANERQKTAALIDYHDGLLLFLIYIIIRSYLLLQSSLPLYLSAPKGVRRQCVRNGRMPLSVCRSDGEGQAFL